MDAGRRRALHLCLFALAWPHRGVAQGALAYPSKAISLIVGFPPGGSGDFVARELAPRLSEALGKPFVVENKGGANGLLAAHAAAAAAPDGHTLFIASMGLTTNPHLYSRNRVHPVKDFTAISLLVTLPNVLVVNPQIPVRNFEEFLRHARSRSTPLTSATTGQAAPGHLASELLKRVANIPFEFIAYKGSGPALTDVVAGHVDMSMPTLLAALPLIKAGRLRAIAVTGAHRSPLLPDVPTLAEGGLKDLETTSGWYGLFGPAGMAKPIVDRLSAETAAAMKLPEVQRRFVENAAVPAVMGADATAAFVAQDYKRWGDLIQAANIKPLE